jgi:hypothetical protein
MKRRNFKDNENLSLKMEMKIKILNFFSFFAIKNCRAKFNLHQMMLLSMKNLKEKNLHFGMSNYNMSI